MRNLAATIQRSLAVQRSLLAQLDTLEAMAQAMATCVRSGGTILAFGNGGSAADAEHLVAELVGRFARPRPPMAAVALTSNTALLTAIANDMGFDCVFGRQVEALVQAGDVVVGVSTSGRSPNVLQALAEARQRGAITIALTGEEASELEAVCDLVLRVASDETPRIQEAHRLAIHCICQRLEELVASQEDEAPVRHS